VDRQQCRSGFDQAVDRPAFGGVGGNRGDAPEEQRVMGDEQLRAPFDGLVDDLDGGIHGEHDARDVSGRMAGHEAHLVP
jgi:hypothetical protein